MELLEKVEYIAVHHSANSFDFPAFLKFRHESLRQLEDCGYHYLIGNALFDEKASVYPGRLDKYQGDHVDGYNARSIGICMLGDLDKNVLTSNQLSVLVELLNKQAKKYKIPVEKILGHNEFPGVTQSCPGKNIDMKFIRESLSL